MVIDTLDNFGKYVALNPLFAEVEKFMQEHRLEAMETGKYAIKGDDLFVNITVAKGREPEEAVLETHKKMIDIQIPLDTDETFGYTTLGDLPQADYNEEKDITKYDGMAQSFIDCKPGMFAIFFPQDGHAPCISLSPEIKKAIFKVKA